MRTVDCTRLCRATILRSKANKPQRIRHITTPTSQSAEPSPSSLSHVVLEHTNEPYRTTGPQGSPDYIPFKRGYAPNMPLPPGKFGLPKVKPPKEPQDPKQTAPEPTPRMVKSIGIEYERQLHAMRRGYVHWRHSQLVRHRKQKQYIQVHRRPPQHTNFRPSFAEEMTTPSSSSQLSIERTLFAGLHRSKRTRGAGYFSSQHQHMLSRKRHDLIQQYLALYHTSKSFVTTTKALDEMIAGVFVDGSSAFRPQELQSYASLKKDIEAPMSIMTGNYVWKKLRDRETDIVEALTGTLADGRPGFEEVIREIQVSQELEAKVAEEEVEIVEEKETAVAEGTEGATAEETVADVAVTNETAVAEGKEADHAGAKPGDPAEEKEIEIAKDIETTDAEGIEGDFGESAAAPVATSEGVTMEDSQTISQPAQTAVVDKSESVALDSTNTMIPSRQTEELEANQPQNPPLSPAAVELHTRYIAAIQDKLSALAEKQSTASLTPHEIREKAILQNRFNASRYISEFSNEFQTQRPSRPQLQRMEKHTRRLVAINDKLSALTAKENTSSLTSDEIREKAILEIEFNENYYLSEFSNEFLEYRPTRPHLERMKKHTRRLMAIHDKLSALTEKQRLSYLTEDDERQKSILESRFNASNHYVSQFYTHINQPKATSQTTSQERKAMGLNASQSTSKERQAAELLREQYRAGHLSRRQLSKSRKPSKVSEPSTESAQSKPKLPFAGLQHEDLTDLSFPDIEQAMPSRHQRSIADMAAEHEAKVNPSFRQREDVLSAAREKVERAGGKTLFPELASVSIRDSAELEYLVRREEFERRYPARRVPFLKQLSKGDPAVETAGNDRGETRDTVEENGAQQVPDTGNGVSTLADEIQSEGDQHPRDDLSGEIDARDVQRVLDEQALLAEIRARRLKRKGRSNA